MKLTIRLKSCLVLLLVLSFTSYSLASPGRYVNLKKNDQIPWDGWWFDSDAMAKIITDRELADEKCKLRTAKALESQQAEFNLRIGKLNASMNYEIKTRESTIEALKEENLKIEEAFIHEQKFGWIAPASIGALVGALTIFLVTL